MNDRVFVPHTEPDGDPWTRGHCLWGLGVALWMMGDSKEAERPSEASLCFVTGDAGIIGPRGVRAPRAPLADAHDLEVARGMGGGRLRLFQASPRPRGEYQALVGHR